MAVDMLVWYEAREFAAEVAALTRDPDPLVRAVAAHALWELDAREQIPALLPLLDDDDAEVRRIAAIVVELLS